MFPKFEVVLIELVVAVIFVIGLWKVFVKAGRPGWAAIVPFYNTYTLLKIAGRPGWWLILYFIPIVNFVVALVVALDIAKVFGRSAVFGVLGLWLFSIIGYLMLGFGSSQYVGGSTPVAPATPTPPVTPPTTPTVTPPAAPINMG